MGVMGTGTLWVFGTLHHTAYPCCGVAGTHRFIVISLSSNFSHFKLHFVSLFIIISPLYHIMTESAAAAAVGAGMVAAGAAHQ